MKDTTIKKILHLNLKKEYFDQIKDGTKKEEYREIKKHWICRFCTQESRINFHWSNVYEFVPKKYDVVHFRNGYAKNASTLKLECKKITIERGIETPLGTGDFFVIHLGEIIE